MRLLIAMLLIIVPLTSVAENYKIIGIANKLVRQNANTIVRVYYKLDTVEQVVDKYHVDFIVNGVVVRHAETTMPHGRMTFQHVKTGRYNYWFRIYYRDGTIVNSKVLSIEL